MSQGQRASEVFATELEYIQSPEIKQFVVSVFDKFATEQWWNRACSLSGKYHPLLSQNIGINNGLANNVGGLVRHVKLGVWWGDSLCRALIGNGRSYTDQDQKFVDVIMGALIMHDLLKDGDPELARDPDRLGRAGQKLIGGCHGVDLANAIWDRLLHRSGSTEQILMLYGVAGHMGVWTLPEQYQPQRFENEQARFVAQTVHMADYAASRQSDIYMIWQMTQMGLVSQEQWVNIQGYQSSRPRTAA